MIFCKRILFVLFLYKISAATSQVDLVSKLSLEETDQPQEVTVGYVIKQTLTEVSNIKCSMIHLASLVSREGPMGQELLDTVEFTKMAKTDEEELRRVATEYFLIKEFSETFKPSFIEREFSIQKKLQHENIVSAYHVHENRIFMEYVKGCDLVDIPEDWKENLKIFAYIFKKVAEAIKFMHENGVVHGDLKPDNIFISNKGDVKIGDFGAAVETKRVPSRFSIRKKEATLDEYPHSRKDYGFTFTSNYVAPERINPKSVEPNEFKDILINHAKVTWKWIRQKPGELKFKLKPNSFPTKESDIYSFGVTFVCFLISRNAVRYDCTYFSFKEEAGNENYTDILNLIKTFDINLATIINKALHSSPKKRPTIQLVLKCFENLSCCTDAEFESAAAKIQEPKMTPYAK